MEKVEKVIIVLLGCILILYGIEIYFDPTYYDSKHGVTIDFTGINHPLGILFVIVGCLLLWAVFRKKNRNNNDRIY